MARVLAFDLGASSGRAMLGSVENGKLTLEEVHRFVNDPVTVNGTLTWDFPFLLSQIEEGIRKAAPLGFDSIGIDTWGVDFGLIDESGNLLENPVHYRDGRTECVPEQVWEKIGAKELYARNGIQHQRFNTLFQLYYLAKNRPELLAKAKSLLFIPDLIAFHLTGRAVAEATIASTSQLLLPSGKWDTGLCELLGLPARLLPDLVKPGQQMGTLKKELAEKLGCPCVPVIAVAEHDTASAVAAVPVAGDDFVYISSGTWSLMGAECARPVINDASFAANLTNEGGFGGTFRLLKNIMGLWLLQESRRQWKSEGKAYSFAALEELSRRSNYTGEIDPDSPSLYPPGDVPGRIKVLCASSGVPVPESDGEVVRCIYNSLAAKYARALRELEGVTGIRPRVIHVIGGGSKDETLCRLTAKRCGLPLIAGPAEATAAGNVAVQLIALGELQSLSEARALIARSLPLKQYPT